MAWGQGGSMKQTRFEDETPVAVGKRCSTEYGGCGQFKALDQFIRQRNLVFCDACCAVIAGRFGLHAADFHVLQSLLHLDQTYRAMAVSRGARRDCLTAIDMSHHDRVARYAAQLVNAWGTGREAAIGMALKNEIMNLAGIGKEVSA